MRRRHTPERDFQAAVITAAHHLGWTVAHFRPGQVGGRWQTPVSGDGAGFPDLVLVNPERGLLLFRELKTDSGRVSKAQMRWGAALTSAGADWAVWRPGDWLLVESTLKGKAAA